jgi:hypothetical protein
MSCATNPFTPEPSVLTQADCCGQVHHVNNDPDCDCDCERGHNA